MFMRYESASAEYLGRHVGTNGARSCRNGCCVWAMVVNVALLRSS
jgi:hypothetical protein